MAFLASHVNFMGENVLNVGHSLVYGTVSVQVNNKSQHSFVMILVIQIMRNINPGLNQFSYMY